MRLVSRTNLMKIFRYNNVQLGLEKIVHGFREQVMDDDASTSISASRHSFSNEDRGGCRDREDEKDIELTGAELSTRT